MGSPPPTAHRLVASAARHRAGRPALARHGLLQDALIVLLLQHALLRSHHLRTQQRGRARPQAQGPGAEAAAACSPPRAPEATGLPRPATPCRALSMRPYSTAVLGVK